MTCCGHCQDAEDLFNQKTAKRDLRRYRKKGPLPSTQRLLEGIRGSMHSDATLLDIGGGVGAVQHELLNMGAVRATQVDASSAYLQASQSEAERRGHRDRVTYQHGDFVEMASTVDDADIVTLDRVICCYPNMTRLVDASASKARHIYGIVYPRIHIATRTTFMAGNIYFRLSGSEFRTFLYEPDAIDSAVRRHGLTCVYAATTFIWHIAVYCRNGAASDD